MQVNEETEESSEDLEDLDLKETPTKKRRNASALQKLSRIPRYTAKQTKNPSETRPAGTTRPENKATSSSPNKSTGRKEAPKTLVSLTYFTTKGNSVSLTRSSVRNEMTGLVFSPGFANRLKLHAYTQ